MKFVYCTAQVERLHHWDGAADIPEVSYLAVTHRHIFHVKAAVEVFSDDREIEFIMMKHKVEKLLDDLPQEIGSCEMLAEEVLKLLKKNYSDKERHFRVRVSEDDENGAEVEI